MRQSDTQPPVGDRLATYVMSAVDVLCADYCSLRGRISNSHASGGEMPLLAMLASDPDLSMKLLPLGNPSFRDLGCPRAADWRC